MSGVRFKFVGFEADGSEIEYSLPAKFEVCSRCKGSGSHVNPSVDGNGLTREDFDQDPDFAESYMRGDYDVRCSVCEGARVVPVPDLTRWSFAQKRAYVCHLRSEREYQRDVDSEAWLRRAESGERW
jgi:hypothetical protein